MRISNTTLKNLALAIFAVSIATPTAIGWSSTDEISRTLPALPGLVALGATLALAGIVVKARTLAGIGGFLVGAGVAVPLGFGLLHHPEWMYVLALAATFYAVVWLAGRRHVNEYAHVVPDPHEGGLRG